MNTALVSCIVELGTIGVHTWFMYPVKGDGYGLIQLTGGKKCHDCHGTVTVMDLHSAKEESVKVL